MCLEVEARLTGAPIAASFLPPIQFLDRSMHADPEDVDRSQQTDEVIGPAVFLDNMFDNQVIPGLGERGYRPVKAIKESFTLGGRTGEFFPGPETLVGKLISGVIAEWFRNAFLQFSRYGCFAGTRSAIDEYDSAGSHAFAVGLCIPRVVQLCLELFESNEGPYPTHR
jgi:hypothetical protein